jgi:hypothetical protein
MKTMAALILSSMSLIATAQASDGYCAPACDVYQGKVNYTCIADKLQAYDSDTFADVSVEAINRLLYTCTSAGHAKAIEVANSDDCQKGL